MVEEFYRQNAFVVRLGVVGGSRQNINVQELWRRHNAADLLFGGNLPPINHRPHVVDLRVFLQFDVHGMDFLRRLAAQGLGFNNLKVLHIYLDCTCMRGGAYAELEGILKVEVDTLDFAVGSYEMAEEVASTGAATFGVGIKGRVALTFGQHMWLPNQGEKLSEWIKVLRVLRNAIVFRQKGVDSSEDERSDLEELDDNDGIQNAYDESYYLL